MLSAASLLPSIETPDFVMNDLIGRDCKEYDFSIVLSDHSET